MDTVHYEHEKPGYILLTPRHLPARTGNTYQQLISLDMLPEVVELCTKSDVTALDFETIGADYHLGITAVGVGLAWNTGSCYLHLAGLTEHDYNYVFAQLSMIPRLIAHNIYFDGGVFLQNWGKHPDWHVCTYQLLSALANDSILIKWGLKESMTNLLLWEDTNTEELDLWLIENGYTKGSPPKDLLEVGIRECYLTKRVKPEYSKMHLAPAEILGQYCVLDAEATYLLYTEILKPVADEFPAVWDYVSDLLYVTRISIEQKISGLPVDRQGMMRRIEECRIREQELITSFLEDPTTVPHIREMEEEMIRPLLESPPTKLRKDGQVSKNYINWQERVARARSGENPDYKFNIQSPMQLAELLHTRMGFEVIERTPTGQPAVSSKTFRVYGHLGDILQERADLAKELSYLEVYLELSEETGSIHPGFRIPGTITGRMSGKEPNLQQLPKSKAMMDLFRAPEGKWWIDLDFAALEPVVTTELSRDPNMLVIYGPDAKPNDLYLFVASSIPGMGEKVRATGYDPYNPTAATVKKAKAECKRERGIAKTVALAKAYGAGVGKIQQTLALGGLELGYEEVKLICDTYDHLFGKVKDYARSLEYEWRRNGKFVLNAFGRPMAIDEDYLKDAMNRVVQSSGHDLLLKYIRLYTDRLTAEGIWWRPLIIDFHDASAIEVNLEDAMKAEEIMQWAVEELNRRIEPQLVRFSGAPDSGVTLTDIKKPEQ